MTHPTPAELLELHFDEARGARAASLLRHARACPDCSRLLADLGWAERLLAVAPEVHPPADGLRRVLAAIEGLPAPARRPRAAPAAVLPSAAAVLAGGLVLALGGLTAGAVFLAAGCLLTLSLAPMLILEARDEQGAHHTAAR
ncbi:MAG TPA: hypothetical protein VEQ10_17460 [Vicinamibacteria bacterium]|nr:hypothetical protein [Vicinamibacteria bacterium]